MAVRLESTIKRFIGLSTDAKPLGSFNDGQSIEIMPAGSSFLESDTGRIYRYDGANWTYAPPADDEGQILAAILLTLNELLTVVKLAAVS